MELRELKNRVMGSILGHNIKSGFEVQTKIQNEHYDIRTIKISSGVKAGQH